MKMLPRKPMKMPPKMNAGGNSLLQSQTAMTLMATQAEGVGEGQNHSQYQNAEAKPFVPEPIKAEGNVPDVILSIIVELNKVLAEELKLLEKQDIKAINALLGKKHRLVLSYQANMRAVEAEPHILTDAPEIIRKKLKIEGDKLELLSNKNANTLRGAIMATHRIIENVMGDIRSKNLPPQNTYTDPRGKKIPSGGYGTVCPAIAVSHMA